MNNTFSVEFATIPTSKRRKLFEHDGVIFKKAERAITDATMFKSQWLNEISEKVLSTIMAQTNVPSLSFVKILKLRAPCKSVISSNASHAAIYSYTSMIVGYDKDRMKKVLKPGDVVISNKSSCSRYGFYN